MKYGATLVYTEMLYSGLIAQSDSYLLHRLQSVDHTFCAGATGATGNGDTGAEQGRSDYRYPTRPLVVQVCGNDAETLAIAARKIASTGLADGIDLNLGCPQDRARDGLFGSYLLDKRHWPKVFACVGGMVAAAGGALPVYCKIRLCEDGVDVYQCTLDFCRGLVGCGMGMICIHGRTRGSAKHRRAGAADLGMIGRLAQALHPTPVVSNGNIVTRGDVASALCAASPCVGVMAAEGLLRDPAVFTTHAWGERDEQDEAGRENGHGNELPVSSSSPSPSPALSFLPSPSTPPSLSSPPLPSPSLSSSLPPPPPTAPDRCALFVEYCALSEAYYAAGGWHRLAVSDACFASSSSGGGGGGSDFDRSNTSASASASASASSDCGRSSSSGSGCSGSGSGTTSDTGTECGVDGAADAELSSRVSLTCVSEAASSNIAHGHSSVPRPALAAATTATTIAPTPPPPAPPTPLSDSDARQKQVDVARSHLLWLLDKAGHGRSVTFGHPGPYKKHPHLLTALKDASTMDDLLAIARNCLQQVEGSGPFTPPQDVKQNILYFNHYLPRV